jgi:hypothetical protein
MLDKSVENYAKLLQQFKGHDKTIAISTPLPTIKDEQTLVCVKQALLV